ncbi:MAG: metallophosphoesterase [Oscillospiraceae bacterium]|jgi:hypothetical protein|nr:metallophosphoesterase [Oscillospiraceae bacterium]
MKKKNRIIGSIVLAAAILAGGAFAYVAIQKPFRTGELTGTPVGTQIGRAVPPMQVDRNGDFVILQFTDTHLIDVRGKDLKTLDAIAAQVGRVGPDLVVVTGDMLDGLNTKLFADKRASLAAIASLFERRETPWAYVPGNNDGETMGTTAEVVGFLAKNYQFCVLGNKKGLTGETQYAIPLLDEDGVTVHELLFMDSLMRDPETHYVTYDCMKQDQADWLQARLLALKAAAPLARASVFFHMNTPAFTAAKNEGAPYAAGYATSDFPDEWSIDGNQAVDDAMNAAGNVGLVSIGHLHPSQNWCNFLDKTYYHIARPSGYQVAKQPGATKITIHTDEGNPRRQYDFEEILF